MTCPRCDGFLVRESLREDFLLVIRPAVRCVNCGFWADPVVGANRVRHAGPNLPLAQPSVLES